MGNAVEQKSPLPNSTKIGTNQYAIHASQADTRHFLPDRAGSGTRSRLAEGSEQGRQDPVNYEQQRKHKIN